MAYAECFVLMLPLRECADRCDVRPKTAFTMRHRLIEYLTATYSTSTRLSWSTGARGRRESVRMVAL